jgi:hypothetical protein
MKEQGTYPIIFLNLNIVNSNYEKYFKDFQSMIIKAYNYHDYLGKVD